MAMITQIEDYFKLGCGRCDRFGTPSCVTRIWHDGLAALRKICLDAGLEECVKWGHPCYTYQGRNIALIGALKGNFRLSFFNPALMTDPAGLLEKQGPNTQNADSIRFTDATEVTTKAATLHGYLHEAIGYAKAGLKAPRTAAEFELPEELLDFLDSDPQMADAFHALTAGRQRSYAILLNGAKTSATRLARIQKARPKILAGKGAHEY
jgi:uncharacterized protein YdeI (YjbR/CyaY-like superfamily)